MDILIQNEIIRNKKIIDDHNQYIDCLSNFLEKKKCEIKVESIIVKQQYIENDIPINNKNTIINNIEDNIFNDDNDQMAIWHRINTKKNESIPVLNTIDIPVDIPIDIPVDIPVVIPVLNTIDIPVVIPVLNPLFKLNRLDRKELLKLIFNNATLNIKKLAELDEKYKKNFDDEVSKESDRLLEFYIKTHQPII
jgi:hypothetical protein